MISSVRSLWFVTNFGLQHMLNFSVIQGRDMSGDNLSGLIRSGASHSVSVSKHTGNAKNPKNIFHSDDQEGAIKKAPLKKHHAVQKNTNIQRVDSGNSSSNVQRIENDQVQENIQLVGFGIAAPNFQELANGTDTSFNRQAVTNESLNDNVQKLGQDNSTANMQQVPIGKGFTSNVQTIPVEGVAANQQVINQASADPNKQSFLNNDSVTNNQVIAPQANGENRQPILNSISSANNAKIAALQANTNKQSVFESSFAKNSQTIAISVPSLNIQSAPEGGPMGVNRQPTEIENLNDHFEVLPSNKTDRARVDLGSSIVQFNTVAEQSSLNGNPKHEDKTVHVKAPLTAQQVTKNKRDAFLGRLAGIKRDVGSISLKLDAMEKSI